MSVREIGLIMTVVFIVYAAYRLWKAFDSPDGERYLKRRMQGPFVPVSKEETMISLKVVLRPAECSAINGKSERLSHSRKRRFDWRLPLFGNPKKQIPGNRAGT